ncbi:hypothetical protein K491DRAFT_589925 [Lophiostoma macrostomum CBS 122681]|uniref:Uncharacterized protein n=1 Tax=Lophiostoma macrostomum CBS 122681 TaxID=1314788 RepID=A0A6A6TKY4_9PLEO|nr:hypothetical protein K491DRAFT_589925 [Lophiostoma macrostomum CBS 122681]
MYIRSLFVAASALVGCASADFLAITETPWPESFQPTFTGADSSSASASWTTSVIYNAGVSYASWTKSQGSTFASTYSSVMSEFDAFVSTASSNYTFSAGITDPSSTVTLFGKPPWWSAMPTGVQSYKDDQWQTQKSIISGVIARRLTTSSSTGLAMPTANPGLKNAGWAVAAAGAALFV